MSTGETTVVFIDGSNLQIEQVTAVAEGIARVELSSDCIPAIEASRETLVRQINEGRTIYGVNAGYGPLSGFTVLGDEDLEHQRNLLSHLTVGQGEFLSWTESRAVMLVRANALAKGNSGVRTEVVQSLLDLLNAGITPKIPSEGSVGASGDLVPLAHLAQALVGNGVVDVAGEVLSARDALQRAGIEPLVLKAKEALALVNGTSAMTGLAALAAHQASQIVGWMELLTASLIQLLRGRPEFLADELHQARGHRGQIDVARRLVAYLLENPSYRRLIESENWGTDGRNNRNGEEIQDPYSIRCTPQIIGAVLDALRHTRQSIEQEVNAATDNPLVFSSSGHVIHGGNFYGQQIALASDYMRIALVKLVLLAERQTERLLNPCYSQGLPPLLAGGRPGLNSGLAGCQLLQTSLAAEARMLAAPASVQTIPTNSNNQDVVSMGMIAARKTAALLPIAWKVLAIEVIAICQAADLGSVKLAGEHVFNMHKGVRGHSEMLLTDRPLDTDIRTVTEWLMSRDAQIMCLLLPYK